MHIQQEVCSHLHVIAYKQRGQVKESTCPTVVGQQLGMILVAESTQFKTFVDSASDLTRSQKYTVQCHKKCFCCPLLSMERQKIRRQASGSGLGDYSMWISRDSLALKQTWQEAKSSYWQNFNFWPWPCQRAQAPLQILTEEGTTTRSTFSEALIIRSAILCDICKVFLPD